MPDFVLSALPVVTPLGALLAVGVWVIRSIMGGQLIPQPTHDQIVGLLREENGTLRAALERQDTQITRLTETGETSLHLLRSIAGDGGDT